VFVAVPLTPALAQSGHDLSAQRAKPPLRLGNLHSVLASSSAADPAPQDSDAPYTCTLSGFGQLAHCKPR
jgi:hypothetical protein